jgi:hypothetical protein
MITHILRIIISRGCTKPAGAAAMLLTAIWSSAAEPHTRRFPEINLIRGRTAAGLPYLNGGVSFAEQRVMERADDPYNLKLVFASRLGTLVTPAFVLIGANDRRHIEKIILRAPWLYIQLPPGGYTILTRFNREVVLVKDVNITEQRIKTFFLRGD